MSAATPKKMPETAKKVMNDEKLLAFLAFQYRNPIRRDTFKFIKLGIYLQKLSFPQNTEAI